MVLLGKSVVRGLYRKLDAGWMRRTIDRSLADVERFHKPALIPLPDARRVLVLAPHMDDEVIGCGGTLVKHVLAGAEVSAVFLTDGARGDPELNAREDLSDRARAAEEAGLRELRKAEARRAAEILGIQHLAFLDRPDGALAVEPGVVSAVREAVLRARPDVVYLPFLLDRHRDHWHTNCIFVEAVRGLAPARRDLACYGYEIWSPLYANAMVEIKETIDVKRRALEQYASQLRHADYLRGILGLNAYRSIFHLKGGSYVEAFFSAPFSRYEELFRNLLV